MLHTLKVLIGATLLTLILGVFAFTGYMFVANGLDMLTVFLGWTMMALTFLMIVLSVVIIHELAL